METALITGASMGLGRALARELAAQGWRVVVDARSASDLDRVAADDGTTAVAGDVTDPGHRAALAAAVGDRLDLLVNNASTLGASPQPALADADPELLRRVYDVNVVAPIALVREVLPALLRSPRPRVVNVTSDAAAEAYAGWGAYGSSKAALEHAGAVLAVEQPELRVWSVDPGDMRTRMHQEAFPGEDISDRPEPEAVVPALVELIRSDRPSGRVKVG